MGKRKERRLAAKSNASRRVKLDLFAEPSGDLGGSTAQEDVGADTDSNHHDGLSKSPSSSGQQAQNPLLLLGQYSDDEMEGDVDEGINSTVVENASSGNNIEGGNQDMDGAGNGMDKQQEMDEGSAAREACQNLENSEKRENDAIVRSDPCKELDSNEEGTVPVVNDVPIFGDVIGGWQIVMHEESKRYYYWNIETGETSWEVPEVLTQAMQVAGDQKTLAAAERTENAPFDAQEHNMTSRVKLDDFSDGKAIELSANLISGDVSQLTEWNILKNETVEDTNWGNDAVSSGFEKLTHDEIAIEDFKDGNSLSSRLVNHSEFLLEKLESLRRSNSQYQSLDMISKLILEIEIRLSDITALLSSGSSLHPFWVHSEKQLQRIEASINEEIYKIGKSSKLEGKENDIYSFSAEDKFQGNTGHESVADGAGDKVIASSSGSSFVSSSIYTAKVVPDNSDASVAAVAVENVPPLGSPTEDVGNGSAGAAFPNESSANNCFEAAEDVDMDVDMEVEDASAGNTAILDGLSAKESDPAEQSIHRNHQAAHADMMSNDVSTLPPSDEEWIPPPPPDNDLVPPPLPDEPPPPEPSYPPPSYAEAEQHVPYPEQYNLHYADSNFQYCGHVINEVSSNSMYGQGFQVAIPQAPIYYGDVSNTFAETAQFTVDPIVPVAYYEFQDGTIPPAPIVSTAQSSQLHGISTPVSYGSTASDHVGSINSGVTHHNLLATEYANDSMVGSDSDTSRAPLDVPTTTTTIQASSTILTRGSIQELSTDAVSGSGAVPATSTVARVQSKATRGKKRTVAVAPTLRSNKKVSSLVDKWKAAKEELLEDEEEPENAYEMLERKRQREIEEWRAKQIASGEAKDNANFQPLGGDWRERVKRRRAQLARETEQPQPEVRNNKNENEQPDLTELSKDLPSGWQAYWDESSKQVYYGNSITSKTTWTRPTK